MKCIGDEMMCICLPAFFSAQECEHVKLNKGGHDIYPSLSIFHRSMGAGQLFNGVAGPVTQAAPTLLSSTWFPSEQRTTATAVAALCGSLGIAVSFMIGPLVVTDVKSELDRMRPDRGNITRNLRLVFFVLWLPWVHSLLSLTLIFCSVFFSVTP